ncbi:Bifunctional PGK/TIM [bacterium HR10]|nr:Bifunctional PGK/TIM [bacterium HR10]
MAKLSIRDVQLQGKRVFLRVDFNVPIEGGHVVEAWRIEAALPTIRYALDRGARVVLASHLGRPKGKRDPKYSLQPVARKLAELLGQDIPLAPDCIGAEVMALVDQLAEGRALLLENLRFHPGEEQNDPEFARQLALLADLYVNDAFGAAHRAHASIEGITRFVRIAAAGFLMERELEYLGRLLTEPERPFVVILGGAKVSDKILVIENLLGRADAVLIGGAMAYTFLRARGEEVGASRVESDQLELARKLMTEAETRSVAFHLPVDHVVLERADGETQVRVVRTEEFPEEAVGMDIGPETTRLFAAEIARARTVFWNGPLGVFEQPPFDRGTVAIARALAECSGVTVVGGGDSLAAVRQAGVAGRITHLSTGGGATLEFLAGIELPGVRALTEKG